MFKVIAVSAIILCGFVIIYAIGIYLETRKMYPKKNQKVQPY